MYEDALKYFLKLEKTASNYWINLTIGQIFCFLKDEMIKGFSYFQKAVDMGGYSEPEINYNIAGAFKCIDYYSKAKKYLEDALSLRPECNLIQYAAFGIYMAGEKDKALDYLDSIVNITPCEQICDLMRFRIYAAEKEFEKAEKYYNEAVAAGNVQSDDDDIFLSYLYMETGRRKEALTILNRIIVQNESMLRVDDFLSRYSTMHLRLAAAYAMLDEKMKAIKYLSGIEAERSGLFEWPYRIRTFPAFDKFRDDPEFNAIVKRIEDEQAAIRSQLMELERKGEINL